MPDVTRWISGYPNVRFHPGDSVFLQAGGCVYVGEHGSPNKHYVRPQGPYTGRLHFGEAWIPMVTVGLEPLRYAVSQGFEIPLVPETDLDDLYLRLGYRDNDYRDNGYNLSKGSARDQCEGYKLGAELTADGDTLPFAYVRVTTIHRNPQAHATGDYRSELTRAERQQESPSARAPDAPAAYFDLEWDSVDANGLPVHANWRWSRKLKDIEVLAVDRRPDADVCDQFAYEIYRRWYKSWPAGIVLPPECTGQADRITLDEPKGTNRFWCGSTGSEGIFHGHINWFPVTYTGQLLWKNHFLDDDYDLDLAVADSAGQTAHNAGGMIHVEFKASETIKHFRTPWWHAFADSSQAGKLRMMNESRRGTTGRQAIVTGLFNLDATHAAYTELHPVFAIAIEVRPDDPAEDHWAMFVRRRGNEGSCAQDQHSLELVYNEYVFALPWREGADSVVVTGAKFYANSARARGPFLRVVKGSAVFVTFQLPGVEEPPVESRTGLDRPLARVWSPTARKYADYVAEGDTARIHGELHLLWLERNRATRQFDRRGTSRPEVPNDKDVLRHIVSRDHKGDGLPADLPYGEPQFSTRVAGSPDTIRIEHSLRLQPCTQIVRFNDRLAGRWWIECMIP